MNAAGGFGVRMGATALRLDLTLRNAFNTSYASYLNRIKTNSLNRGMGRNVVLKLSLDF